MAVQIEQKYAAVTVILPQSPPLILMFDIAKKTVDFFFYPA